MKPFSIAISLLLSIVTFTVFSQDFEVPENYTLEVVEDYEMAQKLGLKR